MYAATALTTQKCVTLKTTHTVTLGTRVLNIHSVPEIVSLNKHPVY